MSGSARHCLGSGTIDRGEKMDAMNRRRWKPWHFIAIGGGVLVAFVAIVFTLVFSLTRPVVDGADAFMGALKDGRYEQAYARAAPSLQRELGNAEGLAARVGAYRPRDWS